MIEPPDFQPTFLFDSLRARPLKEEDFEALYLAASDSEIWKDHPNPNRYQREVFKVFFQGAIESGGALIIEDVSTGEALGSTRYYDYNQEENSVFIGYTFYQKKCWGQGINPKVKHLMLKHAFLSVRKVYFHVGKFNTRSLIAMERLGAETLREITVAYHGEEPKVNVELLIEKEKYEARFP